MKKTIDLEKVKKAALVLARSSEIERNRFLATLAKEIGHTEKKILSANARDVAHATAKGLDRAFVERLVIDAKGIRHLQKKLGSIARLKSGLGEVIEKRKDSRGLLLTKVSVPIGVLAVIYEARPEVTIDVAALCVKPGNPAILKGGSEALETNTALYACVKSALKKSGFSEDSVAFVATSSRQATYDLLKRHEAIDLVIARGSYGMVKSVMEKTRIPVLAHSAGGARIYVDKSANLDMAEKILLNAKLTKPAVCNSLDTILVDRAISKKFVSRITKAMVAKGVTVKTNTNWDTETLGLTVGIKVVSGVGDAISFIHAHTKKHSEGIVAKNKRVIDQFTKSIDAAALFVNASTRFHDGYEFGLGSEMGISTSKLHARGPVGLKELTTYKWQIYGKGNIR